MMVIPKSVLFYIELQKMDSDYITQQRKQVDLFKVLTGRKYISVTYRNPPSATLIDMIREDNGFIYEKETINPDSKNKYWVYRIADKVPTQTALDVAVVDLELKNSIEKIVGGK
jgi:hypothetical protein